MLTLYIWEITEQEKERKKKEKELKALEREQLKEEERQMKKQPRQRTDSYISIRIYYRERFYPKRKG